MVGLKRWRGGGGDGFGSGRELIRFKDFRADMFAIGPDQSAGIFADVQFHNAFGPLKLLNGQAFVGIEHEISPDGGGGADAAQPVHG